MIEEMIETENSIDKIVEKVNDAEPKVLASSLNWLRDETMVLVVRAQGKVENCSNFEICGKKMIDYVLLATSLCKQKVVEREQDIVDNLVRFSHDFKTIAVFYSDTPLLKNTTFIEIMKFFTSKKMNFLPLTRGFIINSEYVARYGELLSTPFTDFGTDDFMIVGDSASISIAQQKLNKRILDFHKAQGVVLLGENTIFIDADVQIESGVIIYPNNVLKGESYIGKNVILESGNYIFDTIVCDDAFVAMSYLEKSKVSEGKSLSFEKLINQTI